MNALQPIVLHAGRPVDPDFRRQIALNLQAVGDGFDWMTVKARRVVVFPANSAEGQREAAAIKASAVAARASSVAVARMPAGLPAGWAMGDALPAKVKPEAIRAAVQNAEAIVSASSLPDLGLAIAARSAVAPFPTDVFPKDIAQAVRIVAASRGAPVDFIAGALLTMVAVMTAGRAKVKVRPGWQEDLVLWTLLVGRPSSNKSPAMSVFQDLVAELHKIESQEAELASLLTNKPVRPTIVALTDATMPAVMRSLAGQDRGVSVVTDEGGTMLGNAAANWKGPTNSDRAAWCEAYSARSRYWHRVTMSKEPILVMNGSVSILAGVQPDVLAEYDFGSVKASDGFFERFGVCMPEPADPLTPAPHADDLEWSEGLLKGLLKRLYEHSRTGDMLLEFTADGAAEFITRRDAFFADSSKLTGEVSAAAGKAPALAARMAGALHLIRWGGHGSMPAVVPDDVVRDAWRLREEYFEQHRQRCAEEAQLCESERLGKVLARHILATQATEIEPVRLRTEVKLPAHGTDEAILISLRELAVRNWLAPGTFIPSPKDWKAAMPNKVRMHPKLHQIAA